MPAGSCRSPAVTTAVGAYAAACCCAGGRAVSTGGMRAAAADVTAMGKTVGLKVRGCWNCWAPAGAAAAAPKVCLLLPANKAGSAAAAKGECMSGCARVCGCLACL
jgi:hypothetical protein